MTRREDGRDPRTDIRRDVHGPVLSGRFGHVDIHTSPPVPRPIPLQRPPRAEHFLGRQKELADLLAELRPGHVATRCGPGGIGKTALAAEAIWTLAPGSQPPALFPDGMVFHSFYHQPDPLLAMEAIARAYGVDPRPSPEAAARQALAGRCALLVLDGAEAATDLNAVVDIAAGCCEQAAGKRWVEAAEQENEAMTVERDKKRRPPPGEAGPQTVIHGDVHGEVLSGNFNGPVYIRSTAESPSTKPESPDFQSETELTAFLQDWIRGQWKTGAGGGTGRSGNVILNARWQGQPALLKVSADAAALRAEAAHLAALRAQGVGLSVARLFAHAEALEGDDRWMAYLMEPVGEMSLRDYLFTATPSPGKIIESLGQGLAALYCRTARPATRDFVAEYVKAVRQSVEKARGYATFANLAPHFEADLAVKGVSLAGPGAILAGLEERLKQGDTVLRALNPAQDCHVHGDLHFENVRINPAEAALGLHWLIDPKEFDRSDYVYDLAKLLTSLTGHAHADVGENEKGNPRLKWTAGGNGRIEFNCILTKRQVVGWREGLAAIEALAVALASPLEATGTSGPADAGAAARMKQRLLLALARHYFSTVRFFLKPEAQWLLFARGTQFLAMFQAALDGKVENEWDPFRVCGGDGWLETV